MKYFIYTFGCEANRADSERIARKLEKEGYEKAASEKQADLIVLNACSVRQSAFDRVYGKINGSLKTRKKRPKIILSGCVLPQDRKKMEEKVDEIWHPDEYFEETPLHTNDFTAFVPIMTGCNNFCTYCAVPYTRGRERSRKAADIIKEIKKLAQKGYKEIWLLGQNVNSYKSGKINFAKLLEKINKVPGDFWIRFTSPHPKDFSGELIKTIAKCDKVTKYINLPVQSGDNEILKKMNRNYTREHYIKLVEKIRKQIPDISISTDTIVGFCGETRAQFLNTKKLYNQIGFDMGFIARYSTRSGTAAALTMKDTLPHKEKERRRKELTEVLAKTALKNNEKLVGQTARVLVDYEKKGRLFGKTEGNKIVEIVDADKTKIGDFVDVKITEAESWKLKGVTAKPKIIVVLGPTSSGKSDLAVLIAKKFPGEIVSADSRQVYTDLNIGSGKVTKKEMGGIKHYLLDVCSPKKIFNASDFKDAAEKAIAEILNKKKLPIICGGTGFYISLLLGDMEMAGVEPDWGLRKKLEKKSAEELFVMLKKLNKNRAKNIDPKNKRRLIRAIEILKSNKPAKQTCKQKKEYDVLYLGIKRDEKGLKGLIEKRIKKMLKMGLLKEVKNLHAAGVSWKRMDELGFEYKYPALFVRGKISREEMIERMLIENYKYAKRQMTWFNKYAPKTHWLGSEKEAHKLTEKFLKN